MQIASLNSTKTMDELAENVERLALALKSQTLGYIRSFRAKWERAWCPDPSTNEVMEDGPIPPTSQAFIRALERKNRWVCGFCLSSITMIQKATLVIWAYRGEEGKSHLNDGWQSLRGSKGQYPVVPVVLHGGHYFALRPAIGKKYFARNGERPQEEEIPVSQGGQDVSEITKVVRGGTGEIHTEQKK